MTPLSSNPEVPQCRVIQPMRHRNLCECVEGKGCAWVIGITAHPRLFATKSRGCSVATVLVRHRGSFHGFHIAHAPQSAGDPVACKPRSAPSASVYSTRRRNRPLQDRTGDHKRTESSGADLEQRFIASQDGQLLSITFGRGPARGFSDAGWSAGQPRRRPYKNIFPDGMGYRGRSAPGSAKKQRP